MQLSQEVKTFWRFLSLFLKSALNFRHFEKKGNSHGLYISETTESQRHVETKCLNSSAS